MFKMISNWSINYSQNYSNMIRNTLLMGELETKLS